MTEDTQMYQQTDNQFKAIVMGGTGAVGAYLVNKLINSPLYSQITVISRRELPSSPKLNVVIWDDFSKALPIPLEKTTEIFKNHHVVFCCLGAPELAMIGLLFNPKKFGKVFRTVDYEYVVGIASAAHQAGVPYFSVISSPRADPKAWFPVLQIKGEMEHALQDVNFKGLSIFRPGSLMKPAIGSEPYIKRVLKNLIAFVSRLVPGDSILVEDVAEAMKNEFERRMMKQEGKVIFYEAGGIRELLEP